MSNKKHLTTKDLKEQLGDEPSEVTDQLYGVAQILLAESLDRTKQLDTKAMSLTGHGAVIIALLVSGFAGTRAPILTYFAWRTIVLAGWVISLSIASALSAVWIAEYHWFSDFDWFGTHNVRADASKLKRFHLLVIHQVKCQHEEVNAKKAKRLKLAYSGLAAGGLLLAVALLLRGLGL